MTLRNIWEYLLIELSKVDAPSLLLDDFNYFINKAIKQYVNKLYSVYDTSLQTTDNLRVLSTTVKLEPKDSTFWEDSTKEVELPSDYMHLLNCICIFKLNKDTKCKKINDIVQFPAKRLTSDSWPEIIKDYYNRPRPENPYFYIHTTGLAKNTTLASNTATMEIRYGNNPDYELQNVIIDYIKIPLTVRLTLSLINLIQDTSLTLEWPDYVCQEIINELTMLVMENIADPRLLTNIAVSRSISLAQQLTQTES